MSDKIVKYIPYTMALIIGMIANRAIAMLEVFTNNELMSNVIGLGFGLVVFALWKLVYYKLITKKKNNRLDQFK